VSGTLTHTLSRLTAWMAAGGCACGTRCEASAGWAATALVLGEKLIAHASRTHAFLARLLIDSLGTRGEGLPEWANVPSIGVRPRTSSRRRLSPVARRCSQRSTQRLKFAKAAAEPPDIGPRQRHSPQLRPTHAGRIARTPASPIRIPSHFVAPGWPCLEAAGLLVVRLRYRILLLSDSRQGNQQHSCCEECDDRDPARAYVHSMDKRVISSLSKSGPVDSGGDVAGLFGGNSRLILHRPRCTLQRRFDRTLVHDRQDRAAYCDSDHTAGLSHGVGDGRSCTGLFQRQVADQCGRNGADHHADRNTLYQQQDLDPDERSLQSEEPVPAHGQRSHGQRWHGDRA